MSISIILERALPLGEDILSRIHSGEFVVSGGTIRDQAGRIVKHLVFLLIGKIITPKSSLEDLILQLTRTIKK